MISKCEIREKMQSMSLVPNNRVLFWTYFAIGTLGPILGNLLTSLSRRPYSDAEFLLSWLLWLVGAGLLIACVWSVRTVLLGVPANAQRPVWLYRSVGWLALIEALVWIYTIARVI